MYHLSCAIAFFRMLQQHTKNQFLKIDESGYTERKSGPMQY